MQRVMMMKINQLEGVRLSGQLSLPGDEKIALCQLFLAALAQGTSYIKQAPSTPNIEQAVVSLRTMGVPVEWTESGLEVIGRPYGELNPVDNQLAFALDSPLLPFFLGILSFQNFQTKLEFAKESIADISKLEQKALQKRGAEIEKQLKKMSCKIKEKK